jgi:hypothetical protein
VHRADPSAHGEGNEDGLRDAGYHIEGGPPFVGAGRDVEEHQLVGALRVVAGGLLHRIARIAERLEVDPLHHPPRGHVEARDDAPG